MLADSKIKSICIQELSNNSDTGDLASDRAKAIDYYYGDMSDYISVAEDRSEITTRDVLDTIESVLPSLIKIFKEEKNAISGIAVSEMDEAQAKLETEAIRQVFFRDNNGFTLLYTYLKDALLSKVGTFKTYTEDNEWEREEYKGLDPIEVQKIMMDPTIEYEVEEMEEEDEGISLTILTKKKKVNVVVEVVTPEELGVSGDANSIDIKKSRFCWQTTAKTIGELIQAGYDKDILDDLPLDEESDLKQESLARRNLSDEEETSHADRSMRTVWVTECYPLIDRDEDGIPERLKVTLVGGSSAYASMTLLDIEESRVPFSSGTPVLLTHKFYGYSLADLVMDIQEMRTVFFRNVYDNMYLSNNIRMGANENVNLDDLLTTRPGGIVRTLGTDNPGNHMFPIQHPPVSPQSFGLLEVFDEMLKNRTGVGDEVAGLDSNSLANINTGVIQQAYNQARMRIELMAAILAETGLKQCFEDIHRELHLNQCNTVQMKINNMWVDVDPRIWNKDRKFEVTVGIGNASKLQKKQTLIETLQLQEKAQATGYMTPQHLYNTVQDLLSLEDMDINRYFPNPQTFQPPQKGPDPKIMIEAERVKLEAKRAQNDEIKIQLDHQLKQAQLQASVANQAVKTQLEQVKAETQLQRQVIDERSQIMRAENENMSMHLNNEIKVREQNLKEMMAEYEAMLEQQKLRADKYEADLKAMASLEEKSMEVEQRAESDILKHIQAMTSMLQSQEEKRQEERNKIIDYVMRNGSDRVKGFAAELGN